MNGFVVTKLDVFEVPVLVVAALVSESTQLCTVVLVTTLHVQHLVMIIAVQDLVAADAPEHLGVADLVLARMHRVSCSTTQLTSAPIAHP